MYIKINKIILLLISLALFSCQYNSTSRKIAQEDLPYFEHRVESNVTPKRTIEEVGVEFKTEKVVKLKNARVLIADYELLKKDFPLLRELSDPEIDHWLIEQSGYISIPQAEQTIVNTSIPVDDIQKDAFRPRRYNRAIIFDAKSPHNPQESIGILDVKGTGSLSPSQSDHGNGVATLGEVIREFIYERLMRDVAYDAQIPNKIVGSYAVIDPGFDVVHEDGSRSPAGYYIRQGHDRWVSDNAHKNDWLDLQTRTQIQNIFHKYGIDPNTNIQGTKNKDIFDFGHFIVRRDLATIEPDRQVPFETWGYNESIPNNPNDRWFYSKQDNPWNWSHELADAWRKGEANRHNVWEHYENMIRPFARKIQDRNKGRPSNCASTLRSFIHNN